MEPTQILVRYPGEALPWLRRQLRLNKRAFAAWIGAPESVIDRWGRGESDIPRVTYLRLVPLLERHLATPEGLAFRQTLGDGEEGDDGMTPDELLRRYPRETLRFSRGRLGLSQEAFAEHAGVGTQTVADWESRRQNISPPNRARLAAMLAPHLATPKGEAFARSLGGEGADGRDG